MKQKSLPQVPHNNRAGINWGQAVDEDLMNGKEVKINEVAGCFN